MPQGKAFIFSAPSGSGKTTIVKYLVEQNPVLGFSISASTRDRRGRQEEHGKDYYFLTPEEFKQRLDRGEFVEWQEVYAGNYYGTLKSEIERIWGEGKHPVFDVDVKGGLNLKEYFKERALAIFVKPPSLEVLKQRLIARETESEESLSRRLYKARLELNFEDRFDKVIKNDVLSESFAIAQKMIDEFLSK